MLQFDESTYQSRNHMHFNANWSSNKMFFKATVDSQYYTINYYFYKLQLFYIVKLFLRFCSNVSLHNTFLGKNIKPTVMKAIFLITLKRKASYGEIFRSQFILITLRKM